MSLENLSNKYNSLNQEISAQDCFSSLTADQNKRVENSTTIIEFAKGETIVKQGFMASYVMYIEKGIAKVEVATDSKISTVRLITDDSFIGIACCFARKNLGFSAIALEDTSIRIISLDVFLDLIRENGEFALKLISHMSHATTSMMHWMSRIASKNVEASLAIILKEFSDIYSSSSFTLPVTRVGLSSMAGCSKESVIHTLTQFHNDKIIELEGKNIKILKPDNLNLIIKNG